MLTPTIVTARPLRATSFAPRLIRPPPQQSVHLLAQGAQPIIVEDRAVQLEVAAFGDMGRAGQAAGAQRASSGATPAPYTNMREVAAHIAAPHHATPSRITLPFQCPAVASFDRNTPAWARKGGSRGTYPVAVFAAGSFRPEIHIDGAIRVLLESLVVRGYFRLQ